MGKAELERGGVERDVMQVADGLDPARAVENLGWGFGILVGCIGRQVGGENAAVVRTAQYDADPRFTA